MLAISITLTTALIGCTKEDSTTSDIPVVSENVDQPIDESPTEEPVQEELTEDTTQSLEQISLKDGNVFLVALKQQNTSMLSELMAHAENEYTETDMALVLGGFQLYFDDLEALQLSFEANEQNDEFYVEHYNITGTKNGEARALPFQVNYAKSQEWEQLMDDEKREPLYNSPLIGEYPYAIREVDRYVQALLQKDTESLALHLGMYDENEQTKQSIEQMLQTYAESLSLSSVEIISKGYDEQADLFLFELRDSNGKTHELRVGEELKVIDEWIGS